MKKVKGLFFIFRGTCLLLLLLLFLVENASSQSKNPVRFSGQIISSNERHSKEIKIEPHKNISGQIIMLDEEVHSLDEVSAIVEKERIARLSENVIGNPADLNHFNFTETISLLSVKGSIEIPIIKNKLSLQLAGRRSYTDITRTGLYKKIFNLYTNNNNIQQTSGMGEMMGFQQQNQQSVFNFHDLNSRLTYKIVEDYTNI
jgi:hypothetical protein